MIATQLGTIPQSIEEISIKRFIALRAIDVNDPLQLFEWAINDSIPLPNNKETERQVAGVLSLITPIIQEVYGFMGSEENLLPPKSVNILGLEIDINKRLINRLPYWAYVRCRDIIIEQQSKGEPFDATDKIPDIIGHYLYEEVTKSTYNEKKANEFVNDVIMEMPFTEAIKLGNFFLLKQIRLFRNRPTSLLIKMMLMRLKLESILFKNTESLIRSKRLVMGMLRSGKK